MKYLTSILLAIGFFLTFNTSAAATTITYLYSGIVTETYGNEASKPGVAGDTFSGYLKYEYAPHIDPTPEGTYQFLGSYVFELNGFVVTNGSYGWREINEAHDSNPDYLNMYDDTPNYDGIIDGIRIAMDIPVSSGNVFMDIGGEIPNAFGMLGTINHISSVLPVPEPSTAFLFVFGILNIARISRNRSYACTGT